MVPHDKLFTPGPVEVSEKTLAAFARPMIGHRGEAFKRLYREIHPQLQTLFGTQQPVFLSTSSAWGVMEAAIRNLVRQRVLCSMCGAFSDKWLEVARAAGRSRATPGRVGAGDRSQGARCPSCNREVRYRHAHSQRDLHRSDEPAPGDLLHARKISEVALVVDSVSSFSAVPIPMDAYGIDVLLTGSQKALALRPVSRFSAFPRGRSRARSRWLVEAITSIFSSSKNSRPVT